MSNSPSPAPILLFMIVVIFLGVIMDKRRRGKRDPEFQRRDDLAALAQKLNLQFAPDNDFKMPDHFSFLSWLNRGGVRFAYNVLRGSHEGFSVVIFDYHFAVPGDRKVCDIYWSAYIVEMNANFPDTLISHKTMEMRFQEALGKSHIKFESADFSHSFDVCSADKKFAYDVCNPEMMDYFLRNRDLIVEINRGALLLLFEDWLHPEKVEFNLSRLTEIRKLLPKYLFTNA